MTNDINSKSKSKLLLDIKKQDYLICFDVVQHRIDLLIGIVKNEGLKAVPICSGFSTGHLTYVLWG